ncbi:hypothetical protein Ahy_B04g070324 [Arachis hypogaea]|uniref:Uncharacterized protein n=1 Tax=Arachis hypogaea TaxID=3818 RepID=A0A444ZG92_ARAHY|nr:hypothetical protein Ahy_B04g070324 [Arachis hypogaea]
MGDVLEETSLRQDNSRTRNPTPEHQEVTNRGRIASTVHHATPAQNKENEPVVAEPRHPENAGDKAAPIIQDLCLRVQELEGRVATKERYNAENGSHTTSRSKSCHGRSPTRQHDGRDNRSTSRDPRREKLPERRHSKRYNRSASRDLSHQHDSDEDRRHRETKRTRNDHTIMGATPFTERILKAKLPQGFDKPTDMKYDGIKDQDEPRRHGRRNPMQRPAIKWFNALPNGSITGFHDISRKFMAQFTTRITKAKHPISLLGVTQKRTSPQGNTSTASTTNA